MSQHDTRPHRTVRSTQHAVIARLSQNTSAFRRMPRTCDTHVGVSTLFVTTANTETLNGTFLGVTYFHGRTNICTQHRTV